MLGFTGLDWIMNMCIQSSRTEKYTIKKIKQVEGHFVYISTIIDMNCNMNAKKLIEINLQQSHPEFEKCPGI